MRRSHSQIRIAQIFPYTGEAMAGKSSEGSSTLNSVNGHALLIPLSGWIPADSMVDLHGPRGLICDRKKQLERIQRKKELEERIRKNMGRHHLRRGDQISCLRSRKKTGKLLGRFVIARSNWRGGNNVKQKEEQRRSHHCI